MAASAANASLDLNQILARRAELGQLAPEDGALVASLLVLLEESRQPV
jgi:hypothetical protein